MEETQDYQLSKSYSKVRECIKKNALREDGTVYRAPMLARTDGETIASAQDENTAAGLGFVCLFAGSGVDRKHRGR